MIGSKRSNGRAEPVRDEFPSGFGIVRTAFALGVGTLPRRWPHSSPLLRTASLAALLSFTAVLGFSRWEDARPVSVSGDKAQAPKEVAVALAESSDRLLDPTPLSELDGLKFEPAVSGGLISRWSSLAPAARVDARVVDQTLARPAASPTPETIEIAASARLPMPRQPKSKVARAHTLPVHGIDVSRWQGKIDWALVQAAGTQFAFKGTDWLIWFLAMISANLAVVNFLPIPIVDGGHFIFLIIEKIQGKPPSRRVLETAQLLGLFFIIGVFLLVTYNDISRMFGR